MKVSTLYARLKLNLRNYDFHDGMVSLSLFLWMLDLPIFNQVCLSLCFLYSFKISLSLSVSLCHSRSITLCFSISLSFCFTLFLFLSFSVSFSVCFFLFLFSFSLLFLNVSNLERYKVHQNNVAGKNLKQYYNVKQQKEKKSSWPESHFCHAWDVANAKLSNLERSDKS